MSDDVNPNEPTPEANTSEPSDESTSAETPASDETASADASAPDDTTASAETPAAPETAAAPETPAIASGGPAPAELGWGTPPAAALPAGGAAPPPGEPPAAPPTEPVAPVPAGASSGRRWSVKQGVLVGLLVLVLGLGGGFAIGRATADSGPSSLADAVHESANGDLPLGNTNGSLSDLLQQLERNGGLQRALRDLLGELGNGNNLFPSNPRNGNGNNNGGNNNNGNNNNGNNGNGNNQTPTTGSAFLGVAVTTASNGQGVAVQSVQAGSPAADAGLKAGDVITAVDGTSVNSAAALGSAVRSHQPGDSVKITYTRGGNSTDVQVRLGNRSTANTTVPTSPPA
jgi:PDZ domain